jgi:hypothetical protein
MYMHNGVPESLTPKISRYLRLIKQLYDVILCCLTYLDI